MSKSAKKETATIEAKVCRPGPGIVQQAEVVENRYVVVTPDSLDDALKPEYWAHHAARIAPLSVITLIDRERKWEADIRVMQKGDTWLRCVVIRHIEYDVKVRGKEDLAGVRERYRIELNGANGWRVVDPLNNQLVDGLVDEAEANAFLDKHLDSLNFASAA
jgi:hypothetical protein